MSSVEKLTILGIRSFGSEAADKQVNRILKLMAVTACQIS